LGTPDNTIRTFTELLVDFVTALDLRVKVFVVDTLFAHLRGE
jgi:hypothetical protein